LVLLPVAKSAQSGLPLQLLPHEVNDVLKVLLLQMPCVPDENASAAGPLR
jgi:hypothetical protein